MIYKKGTTWKTEKQSRTIVDHIHGDIVFNATKRISHRGFSKWVKDNNAKQVEL